MQIQTISTVKPQRKSNHYMASAVAGAAIGSCARYVLPTSKELGDNFFSSVKMNARGAGRSMLKYGGIGALAALAVNAIVKAFTPDKDIPETKVEYSKYGALLDAPDYACEIMWYGDSQKEASEEKETTEEIGE